MDFDKDLYILFSDQYDGQLMTQEAYQEVRRQMSTGDFHCHRAVPVAPDAAALLVDQIGLNEIITLGDLND